MKTRSPLKVAVVMGSPNDLEQVEPALDALEALGVAYEVEVLSAHRTPQATRAFAKDAEARFRVVIAAAGLAAHLAGALASETILPVIGIPVQTGALQGLDALLSTVQMPRGVPVATVAIGKTGAFNAGVLAAEILALEDPAVRERLFAFRQARVEDMKKGAKAVARKIKKRDNT